ncbi:MAG: YebC/PmpR family DNA-binding transcriptional regulator [Clostridiaceae bacterium]|nr:YebC/PmpR family DNA-binding transcriptional regulator [Bacillota bacterium]NLI39051.1 YebC/PmpR family DNA-binding transcriptional regulator [Clostridiaceae bacterium]
MAGHSKWSNIKHKKSRSDALKGKMFTKIGREIAIAVKSGGPDPTANSKLRDAIAKAKSCNMPNDSIMRSIKKASGEGDGANYETIRYEGYGPAGIAVIVETLTDNRNRTAGDIRHLFDKFGGNLGATGCVSYMFDQKGQIVIERKDRDEDEMMMTALDAGASDFEADEEYFGILTEPNDYTDVREKLEAAGFEFESAELAMIPQNYSKLTNPEDIEKMEKLLEKLEDHDDVQNIWHNWEQD